MKITVQLVVCDDDGHEETFTDVVVLEKACQRIEHLGLTLAEAKQTLTALQQCLVEQQTGAFVAAQAQCEHCGKSLGIKEYHTRTVRTLFGTVTLTSPRLYHCRCQRRKTTTFRPLNALLTDAIAPELLFMETKWASLVLCCKNSWECEKRVVSSRYAATPNSWLMTRFWARTSPFAIPSSWPLRIMWRAS
jgi:hypothetical protein